MSIQWTTAQDIDARWNLSAVAALAITDGSRLNGLTSASVTTAVADANSFLESKLRTRYNIPDQIDKIPSDLTRIASAFAAYNLLVFRGFNPNSRNTQIDAAIEATQDRALEELHDISENRVHPGLSLYERAIPQNFGHNVTSRGTMLDGGGFSLCQARNRGW